MADIKGLKGIHRYKQDSEDIEGVSGNQVDIMAIENIKGGVWCHWASNDLELPLKCLLLSL